MKVKTPSLSELSAMMVMACGYAEEFTGSSFLHPICVMHKFHFAANCPQCSSAALVMVAKQFDLKKRYKTFPFFLCPCDLYYSYIF